MVAHNRALRSLVGTYRPIKHPVASPGGSLLVRPGRVSRTPIVGVRKGVVALDDVDGGEEAAQYFGTFSRNAYLWDMP